MSKRSLTFAAALAVGPLALVACGQEAATKPVDDPPRIVVSEGNAQTGHLETTLPSPLIVRVADATNRGVPNVSIDWRVTSGAAELLSVPDGAVGAVTDAAGRAAVLLRPTSLGAITVTASIASLPGAPATFTAFALRKPDAEILMAPGFDCGDASTFTGPDGSNDVTVRVGDVVEWVYTVPGLSYWPCTARLRSTTVPPGGASFDTFMNLQDHFQFVPDVVGTWTFIDATNGGRGTLTVQAR